MKEHFQFILNEYSTAYRLRSTKHPIADIIKKTLPKLITEVVSDNDRYSVIGSIGVGNWPKVPWIAIFDNFVTTSAQSGYYPVFLFRDDMSGVYLSLNQGVTNVKKVYHKNTRQVLEIKAHDYLAKIDLSTTSFDDAPIKLKLLKSTKSSLPLEYEAGNIISKFYEANNLPQTDQLESDIEEILKLYKLLSFNEGASITKSPDEIDGRKYKGFEDLLKFNFHRRIERNSALVNKAKKFHGYTCKACNLNFRIKYGDLGKAFIEAHHLTPLAKLTQDVIELDVRKHFTVLCSNCHRMIHRLDDPSDLEQLKRLIIR